jgi:hypothetical protein
MISDACRTDPHTNTRIGPGFMSTVVIVICFLFLLADASVKVRRAHIHEEGRLNAGLTLFINVGFFGLYFVYYMRCRPWTGFFGYVFVAFLVVLLASFFVPPPKPKEDEMTTTIKDLWASFQKWDRYEELQKRIIEELARNRQAATVPVATA